jgi:peptide/nickel transport system permease protein
VARFVLKHLVFLLATLLAVSLIVFTMNEFAPGDVARKILGAYATPEQVAHLTREMGLDRPLLVRYVEYLGKLARGDLGYSTRFKVPVSHIIWSRLGNTLILAAIAFACIVPLSMLLGVVAGMREGSALDRAVLLFSTVVASVPSSRWACSWPASSWSRSAGSPGRPRWSPAAAGRSPPSSSCRSP